MKNILLRTIKEYGFADAGICSVDSLSGLHDSYKAADITPDMKTLISCVVPYYFDNRGNLAAFACLEDYHTVVGNMLSAAVDELKNIFPCNKFIYFCDNSPVYEVEAAVRAGLGVRGKNNLLLHEKYGSFVFIGEIITDIEAEYSKYENKTCKNCDLCIKSCPADALTDNGFIKEKCVSFILQKKGALTKEQEDVVKKSGSAWGCDICQSVCPYNKDLKPCGSFERLYDNITIEVVESMKPGSVFAWRGKETVMRNLRLLSSDIAIDIT